MTIEEILNTTVHRPWNILNDNWKFYQEWNNAIFLHYQVNLNELNKFVPKELEIEIFEGKPWISIAAFTMKKIRPKNLPAFSPNSDFDEINIRTYVKSNNKAGVYFFSIEGGKSLSCKVAKGISGLPYRFSKIKRSDNKYQSQNSEFKDRLDIDFTIGKEQNVKTKLDKWLTERYALFQDMDKSIHEFEIHHLEWPIREIELHRLDVDYPRFEKLINKHPSKTHYSKGVQVIVRGKVRKEKTSYNNTYTQ